MVIVSETTDRDGFKRMETGKTHTHADGWIGVYDVGYTDNVILYQENLQDDGNGAPSGIQDAERVDEQTGVHHIEHDNGTVASPAATAVDIDDDNWTEHSNVHVGERHWGTDPANGSDTPDRSLTVEVDWLEGHDPTAGDISGPRDSTLSVLEATRENYALYGIDLTFQRDEELTESELEDLCEGNDDVAGYRYCVSPSSFNVWETDLVEDEYHQNDDAMHLFVTNTYGDNEWPRHAPHDYFIPAGVWGLEGATFENVTAVGYLQSQRVVGRNNIGTVGMNREPQITLQCSERPEYFTFVIGDAGCDYTTEISVFRVGESGSEYPYTALEAKHCGDPELPTPDQ